MDIVTFETAKRLKAAGFPQPVPEFGQVWYDLQMSPLTICNLRPIGFILPISKTTWFSMSCDEDLVKHLAFAPTATDILNHSGERLAIFTPMEGGGFICGKMSGDTTTFEHTNPAEAAALAYLAIHERHAAQPTTDTKV